MSDSSRNRNNNLPQSFDQHDPNYPHSNLHINPPDENDPSAHDNEFSTLVRTSPPKKNCCTKPVAAVFLLLVASALIAAWQLLPAEEIAKSYIPKFEEPRVPYTGIEAGAPGGEAFNASSSGFGLNDDLFGNVNVDIPGFGGSTDDDSGSFTVPEFMTCDSDECCNGSAANCVLRVDQMMFSMVHNANAAKDAGFFTGYNQYYKLEKALVAGHRGINLDVCNCNGELQFCHNVCDLGPRYPDGVFTNINDFLEEYPSEVIVLLFEAAEQGPVNWNELYSTMEAVDGFTEKLYVHTQGQQWPTMSQMVQNNQRIIVFTFNGGYCENEICPSAYHPWFNYAAETQYAFSAVSELKNYEYSCQVTRGPGTTEQERVANANFYVVNNFVTPPDADISYTINSQDFLRQRLTDCANYNSRRPNFVYVDFWSEGVVAALVQYANGQMAAEISGAQL